MNEEKVKDVIDALLKNPNLQVDFEAFCKQRNIEYLAQRQRHLKRVRYGMNEQIQALYDRWKRNGLRGHGTMFVPIEAVKPMFRFKRKLAEVEREIQKNRKALATFYSEQK